ncbi:mucin-22-like [Palaemon carinicauda]|uniref:mucin-22-like n=1 Tax=Palaemon carinicauda TaxID=392227 RepID=UPI0035B66CD2
MKLLQRHLVLGWSAILILVLTDYGLALAANSDSTASTLIDSDTGTPNSGSESGSTAESTKSATESAESGTESTEIHLSTKDSDATSSDNSHSMTTEPVEVTTPALDKKGILEKIQEKLGEIRKLLEKLKSLFAITTTISSGLSTTVASDVTTEVSTAVPETVASEGTPVTSTGVPNTVASEVTTVISTGVPSTVASEVTTGIPTTVASEGTTVITTGVPTTVASEGTTVITTGVPTTVASEGTTVITTGVPTTVASESTTVASEVVPNDGATDNEGQDPGQKSKSQKAEEIDDICTSTANEACSTLKTAIAGVETFTSSFDPTGDVSMSHLTEITQTKNNLNDAVAMVAKDPSGVNPEALNTKVASVEKSIATVETKIKDEIQILDDSGTNNTLAIVLGTLGGLLAVAIVATVVIKMKKKKKKKKEASKKTINEDA